MKLYTVIKIIFLLVILATCGLFWYYYNNNNKFVPTIYTVKLGSIVDKTSVPGMIIPHRTTSILSPYDGYIKNIYVKQGHKVTQGSPLVIITQSWHSKEKVYPIQAPFSGTVVLVEAENGENIKKGNFIMILSDLSHFYVKAKIPEIDIPKIKIGQTVLIKATPLSNRIYHGKVISVAMAASISGEGFRSQLVYTAKIKITDPDAALISNMTTINDIIISSKNNIIIIPREYLRKNQDGYYVKLVGGKKVSVTTGARNLSYIEITKGLKVGQKIELMNFLMNDL